MDERDEPARHETTVINTGERGGGSGALIAAVVLLLIVAVGAFLYFGGYLSRAGSKTDIDVKIEAPKVNLPDINIDREKSAPPAGNNAK